MPGILSVPFGHAVMSDLNVPQFLNDIQDLSLLKVFPRNTRESTRRVFKTANFEGTMYKRSPYFCIIILGRQKPSVRSVDTSLTHIQIVNTRYKYNCVAVIFGPIALCNIRLPQLHFKWCHLHCL